jgi:hypothetical protein
MEWGAPGYDPGRIRSYHTALLISERLCGKAVLDLNTNELLSLVIRFTVDDFESALRFLATHRFNPQKPALVTAISIPDQSAMVPEILASDKEGIANLELLHGNLLDGSLRDRHLEESGARFYFTNDRNMERAILRSWPTTMLYPLSMALTRSALARVRSKGRTALLHVLGDRLDLVIVDASGPVLCNNFMVISPEDVLYYALFAVEQTETDPQTLEIYHSGPDCTNRIRDLLQEYFQITRPAVRKSRDTNSYEPADYLALIERDLCVS